MAFSFRKKNRIQYLECTIFAFLKDRESPYVPPHSSFLNLSSENLFALVTEAPSRDLMPSSSSMKELGSTASTASMEALPKVPSFVEGIYNYESSVNFNNYLKELGVSYLLRTFASMASPVVTIIKNCPKVRLPLSWCDLAIIETISGAVNARIVCSPQ